MDIIEQNLFVLMERDHLDGIPEYPLPAGFHIGWYQPGDEQNWLDIHHHAETHVEVTPDVYVQEFGTDLEVIGARQCFLFDADDRPIGTATAWFDNDYHGAAYGRVHWVAVVPDYQNRGLSMPLLAAVLRRMVDLGHDRVYLRTSTARLPAINLYARFGFSPSLRTSDDYGVWSELNDRLHVAFDLGS